MRNNIKLHAVIALYAAFFIFTPLALALNLYEQPKTDSKVIETLDSKAGVSVIFTPKDSAWVKVADLSNGNVGWVKAADLGAVGFSLNVIQSNDGSHGYQVVQYSNSAHVKPLTHEQIQQIQTRLVANQRQMAQMMQTMVKDFNTMEQQWMNMPVLIEPENPTVPRVND